MYGRGFEDAAFEHLKDVQRERENGRLGSGATLRLLGLLVAPLLDFVAGLSQPAASASQLDRRRAPSPRPAPRG